MGRDRLGEPGGGRVDPAVDRLPLADGGRPHPVRWRRGALPVRLADQPGVRPPRPHPRAAQGFVREWFPVAARHRVHARVGRAAGHAARLASDDGVRPGHWHRDLARVHRPRRVDRQPRRPRRWPTWSPEPQPADEAAPGEPPLPGLGRSSRSGCSACGTRQWSIGRLDERSALTGARRAAAAWSSGSRRTNGRLAPGPVRLRDPSRGSRPPGGDLRASPPRRRIHPAWGWPSRS